jgi:putative transport protein
MQQLVEGLNDIPLAGLMLVVAAGFVAGRAGWRGVVLGPAGGTLLVALLAGSAGLSFERLYGENPRLTVGLFGFSLFVYSVGFEAGPRFFSSLRGGRGLSYVAVGVLVNVFALAVAVVCGHALGLGEGTTAGLLAGALTSAPTYAAAAEACSDQDGLALAFAVTYPIGLAGAVAAIHFLPRLMRDDLAADAAEPDADRTARPRSPELDRVYVVREAAVCGRTLAELDLTHRTGCYVTRMQRGGDVLVPDAHTRLEEGDHVLARGRFDELQVFTRMVGPEVYDAELRSRMPTPRRVHLTAAASVGKTLRDLALTRRHGCLVTAIQRGQIVLEPWPELPLERGDVLEVVGPRQGVRSAAAELGRFERPSDETDVAVYAGGIFLGLLLGSLHVRAFGLDLTLGLAGGLLLTGVLL